jgi:hypothetical protein
MVPLLDLTSFATTYITSHPDTNLYLIIDHAGMPGLNRKLLASQVQWANLFASSRESGASAVAPFLIMIGSASSLKVSNNFLRWISESGALTSSLILLASPQTIGTVKERLTVRLDVQLSEDIDAMLRFYDPRVFESLLKILSPQQFDALLCPGEKWWFVSRQGKLTETKSNFRMADQEKSQLSLTPKQESELIDALEPDRVLYLLLETAPRLKPALPSDRYGFVTYNIAKALSFNITSTADFTLYCTVALLYGNNFEAEPYWSQALSQVRMHNITFIQAVADSPEVEYEQST